MSSCTIPVLNKDASGDNLYGAVICNQAYIDYFFNTYGFSDGGDYWHNGFGYEDPCNTDLPLARSFNACYALTYSASDYQNDSYDSDILHWGRRFCRENTDDLRAGCGNGTADALSETGDTIDNHVDLYMGFFYNEVVPHRAATLIHEARHQNGVDHNANFPAGSVFGAGQPGADSDWNYHGAFMFQALYLWWFFAAANGTTSAMQQAARQAGNLYIDNAFATHPGFNI